MLSDLSLTGVGFQSPVVLREGDVLEFHGRFHRGELRTTVRVAHVRPGDAHRRNHMGAEFFALEPAAQAVVERLVAAETHEGSTEPLDVSALRSGLEQSKRRFGRRSEAA